MADDFETYRPGLTSPFSDAEAITDDVAFSKTSRGIWVGVGGDVEIITKGGSTVVLKNAVSGSIIPGRITEISSTNTTATNLVALFDA